MTAAGRPRDADRARVYAAQHQLQGLFDRAARAPTVQVAGSTLTLPPERHFGELAGAQSYADAVLALRWVRQRWARAALPVRVRARRGQQLAHYERDGAVIAVPPPVAGPGWALRELVILHELAHHLTDAPTEPDHGPAFADDFAELLDGLIGPEAAWLFRYLLSPVGPG